MFKARSDISDFLQKRQSSHKEMLVVQVCLSEWQNNLCIELFFNYSYLGG